MNSVPTFRGCTIFRTRVIQQRVSLKIVMFSMALQHGGQKAVETSGVYSGYLKTHRHLSQHIGYSELQNTRRIDIFVRVTCYPETMPISRIVKKLSVLF